MSDFNAKRVTMTYTQKITAPPDKVFPLLCPVREKEWLDGWDYRAIYSDSGLAERDFIFCTQAAGEPETIWTITKHDTADFHIEFLTVTPGLRVGRITVSLEDNRDNTTAAHISYTYTALSDEGDRFVDEQIGEKFTQKMVWWEKSMNHFLTTGKRLKAHGAHN